MLLQLKNVSKYFQSPDSAGQVKVLQDISLDVDRGETVVIVGPSGSGKSTLLNIIGTLDKPTSGAVLLSEQDLSALAEQEQARVRNQEIGFIFQLHHLLPHCTVLENVLIPTLANGQSKTSSETVERARSLIERVGLGERINYKPALLSGGERQRVAVVRALINNPKIILADEPTGSLDATSAEKLGRLLVELNEQQNTSLIVVTHSLQLAQLMKRRYSLANGLLAPLEGGAL